MKDSCDILEKAAHRSGMTVPEGFFDDFAKRMTDSLPDIPANAAEPPRSRWMQLRPYVYMAAMFAGIWCMMKMFGMLSSSADLTNIENHPNVIAACNNDAFVNDHIYPNVDQYDLINDIYSENVDLSVIFDEEGNFIDETQISTADNAVEVN